MRLRIYPNGPMEYIIHTDTVHYRLRISFGLRLSVLRVERERKHRSAEDADDGRAQQQAALLPRWQTTLRRRRVRHGEIDQLFFSYSSWTLQCFTPWLTLLFGISNLNRISLLLFVDSVILPSTFWAAEMKTFEVVGGTTLALALFADVANSKKLLDSMQAGNLEPEVAFLNASLIPDVFPVLAAAHKTLVAKSRESLTTRNLHSELVYNYSGSKHISESLKRCGISDSTSYILAARFGASPNEMMAMKELIKGTEIELEELETRSDQAQIQKHYKLPAPELRISTLSDAITCRIAARDAL